MKIVTNTDSGKPLRGKSARKSSSSGSVSKETKSPFLQILEEVLPSDNAGNYDLHELWTQLPGAEKELLDHPSDDNLYAYRAIIKKIAEATLAKNTRIKKIRRRSRNGETIELSIVEFIDDRLQKMAMMMHSSANSAFSMLKTVEEIRGLLMDVRDQPTI